MFIPLKIIRSYERVAYATFALVAINVVVHLLTLGSSEGALLPYVLDTRNFAPLQLITSQFIHADWAHLIGNMVFLLVYGIYVEERLKPLKFLGLYFTAAVAGDLLFAALQGGRAVGASGAIVGLMGFVVVAAPWAEVKILFVLHFMFVRQFKMAAFWLIGWWFAWEVLSVTLFGAHNMVAHSAHFGGFAAGMAAAAYMRSERARGTHWYLDPGPVMPGVHSTRRQRAVERQRAEQPAAGEGTIMVELTSIAGAPSRVAIIKLLMRVAKVEPEAANALLSRVQGGESQRLAQPDRAAADRLVAQLEQLGAVGHVVGSRRPGDT